MRDGKPVIPCVDDEEDVRDGLRLVLESQDYIVEEAANGPEGLEVFGKVAPDFVLVDMMMERVDAGIKLAQGIKKQASVPVYMLSSMSDGLQGQTDPKALGLDGALQKPVDPEVLISVVKRALA